MLRQIIENLSGQSVFAGPGMVSEAFSLLTEGKRFQKQNMSIVPQQGGVLEIVNAHGIYTSDPRLRFDILKQIRQKSVLPLVLHGGSGISDDGFQEAIRCGIRKVNIATASLRAAAGSAKEALDSTSDPDYFAMSDAMVEGTFENVRHHIRVFSMME